MFDKVTPLHIHTNMAVFVLQAERRRKLGLPPEEPKPADAAPPPQEEKKVVVTNLCRFSLWTSFCNNVHHPSIIWYIVSRFFV